MALGHITRGVALMMLGLLSKAFFLLVIAPGLDDGEFAKYFLSVSIAVILGRFLSFGAHEDLVFRVKQSERRIAYYLRGAAAYYLVAWTIVLLTLSATGLSKLVAVCTVYALLISGNGFMTGALRSYSNVFQEFNTNMPWVLVGVQSVLGGVTEASGVLYYLITSLTIIFLLNFIVARILALRIGKPSFRVVFAQFKRYRAWLPKSLSTIGIAANLRSYPLWLSSLGFVLSDGLAYAFSLGEVVFQLCMVYVHQVHSSIKLHGMFSNTRRLVWAGIMMIVVASIVPLPIYYIITSGIVGKGIDVSLVPLLCASIYCGSLAFFSLLRIGVWRNRRGVGSFRILFLQMFLFVCVGALVILMGYNVLLLLIATLINFVSMYIYMRLYMNSEQNTAVIV